MGPATGGLGLHGRYVMGTRPARYLHNLPGDEAAYVDTASLAARHRNVWVIQHAVLLLRRVGLLLEHSTHSTRYTY